MNVEKDAEVPDGTVVVKQVVKSSTWIKEETKSTCRSQVQRERYHLQLCEYSFRIQEGDSNEKYKMTHPLVYSMLQGEATRRKVLEAEGSKQIFYPRSNEGWWISLRVIEGRALGSIARIWCLVVAHAVVFTCIIQLVGHPLTRTDDALKAWETLFGIALNGTLSLMLVFRQNRAAARWWTARERWGLLVARARTTTSAILVHGAHDPAHRDDAIRWLAAYVISVMEFLRGGWDEKEVPPEDLFCGLLRSHEIDELCQQSHPPLFAGQQIHCALKQLFRVTADTPAGLSVARSQQLANLEQEFSSLLDQCGAMERIKATPLPIVFVAHLRTFLLLALLLYPYVWGHSWGWGTVPIVALAGFALLGIEAASVEVEQPFRRHAVNALNMDGYCIGALGNIQQQIRQQADRELTAQGTC